MLLLLILMVLKRLMVLKCLCTFPIKDNPYFNNGPESLAKNPSACPIFCNLVFDNFILPDEPFAKALWSLEACALVNNNFIRITINIWRNFQSYFSTIFFPDIDLLSCELEHFTFKVRYWIILFWYGIQQNKVVQHAVRLKTTRSETLAT